MSSAKPAAPVATINPAQIALDASHARGRTIFNKDCALCHGRDRRSCPDFLEGSLSRLGYSYLALFITKQDSLRAVGDPYASHLQKVYDMASQHHFDYSPKQINDLISYLK